MRHPVSYYEQLFGGDLRSNHDTEVKVKIPNTQPALRFEIQDATLLSIISGLYNRMDLCGGARADRGHGNVG